VLTFTKLYSMVGAREGVEDGQEEGEDGATDTRSLGVDVGAKYTSEGTAVGLPEG
jgi:hypothetical protein